MGKAVLGIDAGATNVRSMVVDDDDNVLGSQIRQVQRTHPAPGLVEQDPEEIWCAVKQTIDRTLEPHWSDDQREERFQTWKKACQL